MLAGEGVVPVKSLIFIIYTCISSIFNMCNVGSQTNYAALHAIPPIALAASVAIPPFTFGQKGNASLSASVFSTAREEMENPSSSSSSVKEEVGEPRHQEVSSSDRNEASLLKESNFESDQDSSQEEAENVKDKSMTKFLTCALALSFTMDVCIIVGCSSAAAVVVS
jgi:hypothetical protein